MIKLRCTFNSAKKIRLSFDIQTWPQMPTGLIQCSFIKICITGIYLCNRVCCGFLFKECDVQWKFWCFWGKSGWTICHTIQISHQSLWWKNSQTKFHHKWHLWELWTTAILCPVTYKFHQPVYTVNQPSELGEVRLITDFYGTNASTIVNFKVPTWWHHWTQVQAKPDLT